MTMAAQRAYGNDVIARNIIRYLDKRTLRNVMALEQRGDRFDYCVRELWRVVDYEVIFAMTRDSERTKKYLDAVRTVDATTRHLYDFRQRETVDARGRGLRSPTRALALRDKCPNLRTITRDCQYGEDVRYTIHLASNGQTDKRHRLESHSTTLITSWWGRRHGRFPSYSGVKWKGWDVNETAGLRFRHFAENHTVAHGPAEDPLLRLTPDRIDDRVTEIDSGDLIVSIELLCDIVQSRVEGKNRISHLRAITSPFTLDDLAMLLLLCGPDLKSLNLALAVDGGPIPTPDLSDLPFIVKLIREQCPCITTLRLPIRTKAMNGTSLQDSDIPVPPLDIPFYGGTVTDFGMYLYGTSLDPESMDQESRHRNRTLTEIFSFNAVRNLACLLSLGVDNHCLVKIYVGEKYDGGESVMDGKLPWGDTLHEISCAASWFTRLGPILEPHFRHQSLEHLGIRTLRDLRIIRYHVDGRPKPLRDWREEFFRLHFKKDGSTSSLKTSKNIKRAAEMAELARFAVDFRWTPSRLNGRPPLQDRRKAVP